MDEANLADLNDVQDFFKHVGAACKSASSTEEFYTDPINVKDFIGWCNKPLKNKSESGEGDQSCKLGNAVLELNKLNEDELKEMESALKENRWTEWLKDSDKKVLTEDAVFYLELKRRTDNQHHYHFSFDRDAVAEIDAFAPFAKGKDGKQVLDQQWHVLISLLAYLDVAHALSNDQHEYHCLYQHIKNAIQFLLSGNFGAILAVLYAATAGLPVPFAPVHLLFINLLTDSLPAIALGMEPHSKAVMDQKPRPVNESILTKAYLVNIGTEGLCIGIMTMAAFLIGYRGQDAVLASTMAFGTLCMSRLVHGFNCKDDKPVIFSKRFFNNKYFQRHLKNKRFFPYLVEFNVKEFSE